MLKILLVEDEKNFGMVLKDYLRMNEFDVCWAQNGEEGLEKFAREKFDLCVLDVMMPKKDGFSLAKEIRSIDPKAAFIFLTARGMREDMIRGYKAGADDYIVKPFDSELLLLKIRAILGRQETREALLQPEYRLGGFMFKVKLRLLSSADGEIKLSPKEAELLAMLCRFKNELLPRERALKEIWKDENYFTGRSMDVYVARLRKYLASEPAVQIESLHGKGFVLREL